MADDFELEVNDNNNDDKIESSFLQSFKNIEASTIKTNEAIQKLAETYQKKAESESRSSQANTQLINGIIKTQQNANTPNVKRKKRQASKYIKKNNQDNADDTSEPDDKNLEDDKKNKDQERKKNEIIKREVDAVTQLADEFTGLGKIIRQVSKGFLGFGAFLAGFQLFKWLNNISNKTTSDVTDSIVAGFSPSLKRAILDTADIGLYDGGEELFQEISRHIITQSSYGKNGKPMFENQQERLLLFNNLGFTPENYLSLAPQDRFVEMAKRLQNLYDKDPEEYASLAGIAKDADWFQLYKIIRAFKINKINFLDELLISLKNIQVPQNTLSANQDYMRQSKRITQRGGNILTKATTKALQGSASILDSVAEYLPKTDIEKAEGLNALQQDTQDVSLEYIQRQLSQQGLGLSPGYLNMLSAQGYKGDNAKALGFLNIIKNRMLRTDNPFFKRELAETFIYLQQQISKLPGININEVNKGLLKLDSSSIFNEVDPNDINEINKRMLLKATPQIDNSTQLRGQYQGFNNVNNNYAIPNNLNPNIIQNSINIYIDEKGEVVTEQRSNSNSNDFNVVEVQVHN